MDGLSRSGDLTQTYYWGASPYWRQRLGPYADGILRYSFDRVIYANSDRVQNPAPGNPAFAGFGSNSNSHAFEGSLQSGRHFSQFGWNLAHSQRKVDYDAEGVDDPTFRRTNGRITYPLHRELDVYAGAGYDDNDYETTRGGEDQSGTSWEAGATWRPVQATEVTAGWGHRYFGNYWTFDLTHRSRRTVWTAGYSEDITTSRDILREQQLVRQVRSTPSATRSPTRLPRTLCWCRSTCRRRTAASSCASAWTPASRSRGAGRRPPSTCTGTGARTSPATRTTRRCTAAPSA